MKDSNSGVIRIGVDTGGTFTDLVVAGRHGILRVLKLRSTPADPAVAVLEGLRRLGMLHSSVMVIHGTTVATNALLQGRGGKAVLVTTSGFEDLLALGRQSRPDLYRLDSRPRADWIPSNRRLGITERMGPTGKRITALSRRSLQELLGRLRRIRPDAVAVCFLHAYANPAHERLVAKSLRREGWHLSLSHRVAGEFREYERTATTVANAVLARPVEGYLTNLNRRIGGRLRVMGSSGGWMTARRASQMPVRTVLSGPAGGVGAASILGRRTASRGLITLDMGGTSTDLALCLGEVPRISRTSLNGIPLLIPALDIRSLGAGGGSIARCDAGGALRVGPESAGAEPGPACYARGGTEPTLTDANLVLGRLPAEGLLGGEIRLDERAAHQALERLGKVLGMGVQETARGILRVVESSLENAIRALVAERGLIPSSLSLMVFGGAAGLHACELAKNLGVRQVVIPPDAGTFSALGLASSPSIWESSKTVLLRADRLSERDIRKHLQTLEREGLATLRQEGQHRRALHVMREADLRYAGQSHELTLPLGSGLVQRFHQRHAREFGYSRAGEGVELVTLRIRIAAAPPKVGFRPRSRNSSGTSPGAGFRHPGPERGRSGLIAYRRSDLRRGDHLLGPALVTEYSSTTYLAKGFRLRVGGMGELQLSAEGKQAR
jgi:N-methylhydantoinase A